LNGGVTKTLGGKSQRIVAPLFIADDGHFLDVSAFRCHEAHIAPVALPLPSCEAFGNDQRADFSLPRNGFLGDLDDPVIVSLLELSPNSYLQQFSRSIDNFYRHCHNLLLISVACVVIHNSNSPPDVAHESRKPKRDARRDSLAL